MLTTGIFGFYLSKSKDNSDENRKIIREIYNPEITTTTTPKPFDFNNFAKTFDTALKFVESAPSMFLTYSQQFIPSIAIQGVTTTTTPKTNVFSVIKNKDS
jgi:hypothetical protein